MKPKRIKRIKRHLKIRKKVFGSENRPRLTVFRSNKYTYAQLVDDTNAKTIVAASDKTKEKNNRIASAKSLGLALAKKAHDEKIKEIVFDRGGYKYHGRIKAVAEGLREGGLKF